MFNFIKRLRRRPTERAIVTKVIETLLARGYALSVDAGDDGWVIHRSTDKAALLDAMFNRQVEVLHAHESKHLPTGWVGFKHGSNGRDFVTHCTPSLTDVLAPTLWIDVHRDGGRSALAT
jgi:hypothetical protein